VTIPSAERLAVFRVDASTDMGTGHVVRCLTLADALSEAGWRCAFACRPGTVEAVPSLTSADHFLLELDGAEAAEPQILARRWPHGVELLVVDHYGLDAAFTRACRPWARRILVVDDLAERRHDCEILLDQTLGRSEGDYRHLVPGSCRLLLGPQYALLRPQFAAARREALARRAAAKPVRRILVSFGGTDPSDATSLALRALAESRLDVEVDVVLGRAAAHLAAVSALAARLPQRTAVHVGVADMAALMRDGDLAIAAAGTSAWERCCLGLASIVIPVAGNQQANAAALTAAGAARVLPGTAAVDPAAIARALERLSEDGDARAAMSAAAAGACDGLGARRLVLECAPLAVSRLGKPVSLRPATAADAKLIFDWQSHPATRRFARNPEVPTWTEHKRWMSEKLAGRSGLMEIILHERQPAGVLRLDHREDASYEVSIFVDPAAHGRGVGAAALQAARWLMPNVTLRAEVIAGNDASHALFRAGGYRWTGECYLSLPGTAGPAS